MSLGSNFVNTNYVPHMPKYEVTLNIRQLFLTRACFSLRGHCKCLETFLVVTLRGCYWHLVGRSRGAAKHPTSHRTTPTTKNPSAQSVSSAEVEKSWYKVSLTYMNKKNTIKKVCGHIMHMKFYGWRWKSQISTYTN